MVANSFDLWKKDVFFPAAEEVQESADMYVPFCFSLVLIMWVLAVLISFCVYFDVFRIRRWVFLSSGFKGFSEVKIDSFGL